MNDTGRVYAAEDILGRMLENGGLVEIAGSTILMPVERKFGGVQSVETYLKRLHGVVGVGLPIPTTRVRKGSRKAHYEAATNTIAIPEAKWALRETVVLHEYAHYLTWQTTRRNDGHGLIFQQRFKDLLDQVIGPEAAFAFTVLLTKG